MLINKTFKPWLTCSADKVTREVLAKYCYLDTKAAVLVSTDGRVLSRLPIEVEEGDITGMVPVDALKAAVKLAGKLPMARIECSSAESVKLGDGRTWPRCHFEHNGGKQYPNYEQVVPNNAGRATVRIALNPVLLANLFAAMGDPEKYGAVLEFQIDSEGDSKPLPVLVTSGGISSVLMPMKVSSRQPNRIDDIEEAHGDAILHDQTMGRVEDMDGAHLLASIEAVNRSLGAASHV